jgi:hypothetical protein
MIKSKFAKKTSEEDKIKIVEAYLSGLTLKEIGEQFSMDASNAGVILKNRKIKLRTTAEANTISFDHSFFADINKRTAYFFGFVLGDGSYCLKGKVPNNVPNISISVHQNDIAVLEMFCNWISMDSSHIFHFKKSKMTRLNIRDNCVANNKEYWGVVERKTYTPIIPQINDNEILKYFLIGLLDADGSVEFGGKQGYKISLVGNTQIIDWFIESITKLGYTGKISHYKYDGKVWSRVCICNKKDVLALASILGISECDFCLSRKWNNIKSFVERTSKHTA